jgi:radical SAM protein with 4Fe4S-binding SPASM domain
MANGVDKERRALPILESRAPVAKPAQPAAPPTGALPVSARADYARDESDRRFRPDVYWYLTFRCNLACQHCSVFSSPDVDTSEDLTTAEAMQVIDQMVELGVGTALMSGGEVLYRPDAMEILRATAAAGVRIGLETNGLLITDEFIAFAREAQAHKLLGMSISLDGGTAETHDRVRGKNTFKRTLENLHRLKEGGVQFSIQCILNKHNYPALPEFMAHARALRPALRSAQLGFLNPVGRGDAFIQEVGLSYADMPAIFALIAKEQQSFDGQIMVKAPPAAVPPRYLGLVFHTENVTGCTTCQFPLLGVLPNGDVTICALSRDNDQLCLGNVRSSRLKDIWTQTRMDMLRDRYVEAEHLAGICGDCVFQKSCKGSCRAWAYEQGGSFDAPFPLCSMLEQSGQFPKAYRLSEQQKALGGASSTGLLGKKSASGHERPAE